MSVYQQANVFFRTTHGVFLKLLMKLVSLNGKKVTGRDFFENTPKIGFFGFCKKNNPFMCRFLGLNHAPL